MRQIEYVPCAACPHRRNPAFKPHAPSELRFVASLKSDHLRAQAGEDIVEAGRRSPVYTLWEGWAFRYMLLPDGRRQIIEFVLPGDLIGLDSWARGKSDVSVQALTPVSLCVLEGRPLDDLFRRQPEMGRPLAAKMMEYERRSCDAALSLGRRSGAERLGWLLLDTFDRLAARRMITGNSCAFPPQRRHLADALGLSGTHVTRGQADLLKQNLADISAGTLSILNRAELAAFAHYTPPNVGPSLLL